MCYGDNAFFSHIEKYLIYLKEGKFTLASEYVSDSNTLSGVIYQLTHHLRYTKGSDFSEISCLKDANIFNGVKWRVVSTEGSYVGL